MQRLSPSAARRLPHPEAPDGLDMLTPLARPPRAAGRRDAAWRSVRDSAPPQARTAHQRRCHAVRCAEADAEIRAAWARGD